MELKLQKGSRSIALATIMFVIMTVFVVRLGYLQIIQHSYYVKLANASQLKRLTIPAKRGVIYALDGQTPIPLVMNQTVYTVFADPQMVKDINKVADVIRKVAGGNARANLETLIGKRDSRYQILATKVTRTQADKIKSENLKGVGFQEESQRVYPEGALASQTLGFVDFEGTGRYGVEGKLNNLLVGQDGLLQSVTDISDVPLTIGKNNINKPAIDGDNIVLSIDRNIQSKVEKSLADGLTLTGATKGSIIVMDPQNGKVMAMANFPTYNPAEFNKVKNVADFNNDVVSAPYEPGSVIKTLTMSTGIEKGAVTPTSTYVNTDYIKVDDITISNASLGQTGTITFQHALNWSLNTGFVTVAQRLGDGKNITREARNTMYDFFYNRFKLGQLTNIEVSGEARGVVISPEKIEGNAVRYSNMSFGQGLDVTMVQVASAFSSIVNGGNYYKPTILAGVINTNGEYIENQHTVLSNPISKSTSDQMREMIHTARYSVAGGSGDVPGYYIGGKTGTSQVLKDGTYSGNATIGTYLGFGGSIDVSRYVIMVQISGENKSLSGQDARIIFTDISNWMPNYLKIQPKG